jgi:hypothetical protein
MKRLLWLGVGLAVGALVVRAVTKKAQSLTPSGLASSARESAGGLLGSIRSFADDVRVGMAEREQELHEAFVYGETLPEDEYGPLDDLEGFSRR